MEQFDTGMITDHHYSGNIKLELRKCSDAFVKMSSQGATKQTKKKLYSTLGHLDCFDLAGLCLPGLQLPQGKNVPGISRCTLFFRQRGLDILNSDPKQLSSTPPPPPPALSVIGNCLSHPLYLWVSVCLTLVQLGLVSP